MTRARDLANLIGSGNYTTETLTATAGQTVFTPSNSYTPNFIQIYMNGLLLDDTVDYTATNGTTITLTVAASAGDEMEVVTYNTFSVGDAITQTEADGRYYTQTEADNRFVNVTGDTITGNLLVPNNIVKGYRLDSGVAQDNAGDVGLNIYSGNSSTSYGRIRFLEGVSESNTNTIHSFPNNWQNGTFSTTSSGALNLDGPKGVTFGPWYDPFFWASRNTSEVIAKGQLKQFENNLVIDDERGTNIAVPATYVMSAGINYKLAEIMQIGDQQRVGLFGILIWMGDGGPHAGGTHYWSATYSGVIGPNSSGTAYNATGAAQLTLNRHYHHITVAEPSFYLDSDNSAGAYGNTNLYINVPVDTKWTNIQVYLKRLAW